MYEALSYITAGAESLASVAQLEKVFSRELARLSTYRDNLRASLALQQQQIKWRKMQQRVHRGGVSRSGGGGAFSRRRQRHTQHAQQTAPLPMPASLIMIPLGVVCVCCVCVLYVWHALVQCMSVYAV